MTIKHDDLCPCTRFHLQPEFCTCGAASCEDDINASLENFGKRLKEIGRKEAAKPEMHWSGEPPYHVARVSKNVHYSIERVDGPVTYFELKGTYVWPARKFLSFADAKEEAQRHFDQRAATHSS